MSANTSAILIATVGVLGTLASPIVSQRLSARARRDEFEMERSRRLDDRQHEQRQLAIADKRSCYIALLANSRRYRVEIANYLHMVRQGTVDSVNRGELEAARRAYIVSSAEAQMTASRQVLAMIDPFHTGLAKAYRVTKNLEDGKPEPNGPFEESESLVNELTGQWKDMQEAMRRDLGVED